MQRQAGMFIAPNGSVPIMGSRRDCTPQFGTRLRGGGADRLAPSQLRESRNELMVVIDLALIEPAARMEDDS